MLTTLSRKLRTEWSLVAWICVLDSFGTKPILEGDMLKYIPSVIGWSGGIVGVMYQRYVGYIKVFTPAAWGLSHGSTKGVFAHLGLTATIRAPGTPRHGTPGDAGRHGDGRFYYSYWLVPLGRIPSALSSLPRLLYVRILVPRTWVLRQPDTGALEWSCDLLYNCDCMYN